MTFGAADELTVDENGIVGGGQRLKPKQVHELLEERGDDVVFFDDRVTTKFSDQAQDIGHCVHCAAKTSNDQNCAVTTCNKLILVCSNCQHKNSCRDCFSGLQVSID